MAAASAAKSTAAKRHGAGGGGGVGLAAWRRKTSSGTHTQLYAAWQWRLRNDGGEAAALAATKRAAAIEEWLHIMAKTEEIPRLLKCSRRRKPERLRRK